MTRTSTMAGGTGRPVRSRRYEARCAVIAIGSGVSAAAAGASPTGDSVVDAVMVAASAAAVTWLARSVPWWAGAVAAVIGIAFAPTLWLVVVSVGAGVGAVMAGRRISADWARCAVVGVAIQVLARLGDVQFFGFTSALALSVAALVVTGSWRVGSQHLRRLLLGVVVGAGVIGGMAVVGLAIAASAARAHLEAGSVHARSGVAALGAGRFDVADIEFARAADEFADASVQLERPWASAAGLVPVVAQHRRSAVVLSGEGAIVARSLGTSLDVIDPEAFRVIDGRIDVDAVRQLAVHLDQVSSAVGRLERALKTARSPWLIAAVATRMTGLEAEVDEQRQRLDDALVTARSAPAMLGADAPRRYFVGFTTASEARALGGFMGNWAEATIDEGRIEFTAFGSHLDLNEAAEANAATLSGPSSEFLDQYGSSLLADRRTGVVGPAVWSNITVSPHFPSVAAAIAELYPQSGGRPVDGVFLLDVEVMAELLRITGSIELPDVGITLSPANAADFLYADQYLLPDRDERRDLLERVARTTMDRLLVSAMPDPRDLGERFGHLARAGRLLGWASRPAEQDVIERAHMDGLLPPVSGGDALGVSLTNAGGSKIDWFLRTRATYDVRTDRRTAAVRSELTLHLHNTAPSAGLPDYVIGNRVDVPDGTSVLYLTVHSALGVESFEVDGRPRLAVTGTERGYVTSSTYLAIGAGEQMTVTMTFGGAFDVGVPYRLNVSSPPLVESMEFVASVDGVTRLSTQESGVLRVP